MKPGSWAWTSTPCLCRGPASAKAEKSREGVPWFCSITGMKTDQLHGVLTEHCWWGWIRSLKLFIGINIRVGWWWLSIWEQNVKNGSIIHTLDSLNPRITYQSECANKTLWGCGSPSQTHLPIPITCAWWIIWRYPTARKPKKCVTFLLPLLSGWEVNTQEKILEISEVIHNEVLHWIQLKYFASDAYQWSERGEIMFPLGLWTWGGVCKPEKES